MSQESIPVLIGACLCPGAPHEDGDFVHLRPKLGLGAGTMLQRLVIEANQGGPDAAEMTGKLAEAYLRVGVVSWSLADEKGPIPVNPDTIAEHLLSDFERATPVADKADDLYLGPVLSPLVKRVATSSSTSTTNGSTSATPPGPSKLAKRSKRSLTSTSPTDATATT